MNDTTQESDYEIAAELVARVGAGEKQAEVEVVERYQRGLRFLLRRRTGDVELAEELLQDTWMVAFEKLRGEGIEDPGKLAGYLCGIAKKLALGMFRKAQRRKTEANADHVAAVADDAPSPLAQLSRAEVCNRVRELIAELKVPRDREILLRFYIRDEDKELICRDLGIDGTHFNRVLFRARQRFKEMVLRGDGAGGLQLVDS